MKTHSVFSGNETIRIKIKVGIEGLREPVQVGMGHVEQMVGVPVFAGLLPASSSAST